MSTLHRMLVAGSLAATLAAPAIAGPLPTNVVTVKSTADNGITKAAWGGWGHGSWGGHWGHGGGGWFPGAFLGGLALGAAVSSYPSYGYGYNYPYGYAYNDYPAYAYYDYPAYAYYGGPYYGGYHRHYGGGPYWGRRWHHHW